MILQHKIPHISNHTIMWDFEWDLISRVHVETYPWDSNHYTPRMDAQICYSKDALFVKLIGWEPQIKAKYTRFNEDVYKDSCMEFFLNAAPDISPNYLNFEFNPIGTLLLGWGPDKTRIRLKEESDKQFSIHSSQSLFNLEKYDGKIWWVSFQIPKQFLEKYYGQIQWNRGSIMKGNFYKCGDYTTFPHYGCWNRVTSINPDFHRSQDFGVFVLD